MLVLILKIIGWIILIPTLLLYGFIESFLNLGFRLKRISFQNIVRIVFIVIITLLTLALMGFVVGGVFILFYFSLIFIVRFYNLELSKEFKIKGILRRFKRGRISEEKAVRKIGRVLKKKSRKRIMVKVNSKDVLFEVNIPLSLGIMALRIIPKRFLREKSGVDINILISQRF